MRIINDATQLVPLDDVRPHERNVNHGDDVAIEESIETNGFFGSLVVQKSTGKILAGTHRWRAAKRSGATEIPVTYVDCDDSTALRIMLADNRTARLGQDDAAALGELLKDILNDSGSLLGTGYDVEAMDEILDGLIDPESEGNLRPVSIQPLPTLTWVLIGIPTVRYPEIQDAVDRFAEMEGVQLHLTANTDE